MRETGQPKRRSLLDTLAERLLLLPRARWSGYVFGGAAVVVATAVLGPLMGWTRLANSSAFYTVPVLLTAALHGRGPALATSVAVFVAYDTFLADPAYEHSVTSPREWLTLSVFLVTALVAGQLAAMLRQQAEQARHREREALALYEMAQLVPGSNLELPALLGLILDQLKTIVDYDAAAVTFGRYSRPAGRARPVATANTCAERAGGAADRQRAGDWHADPAALHQRVLHDQTRGASDDVRPASRGRHRARAAVRTGARQGGAGAAATVGARAA